MTVKERQDLKAALEQLTKTYGMLSLLQATAEICFEIGHSCPSQYHSYTNAGNYLEDYVANSTAGRFPQLMETVEAIANHNSAVKYR